MNANLRVRTSAPIENLRAVTALKLTVGDHVVDLGSLRVTTRPGQPKLTPKAAGVLLELARRPGQTIAHDDLLDLVWAGTCPTRNVLTQAIKELRRALDGGAADSCIATVPKIGYRLSVPTGFTEAPSPVLAPILGGTEVRSSAAFVDPGPAGSGPAPFDPARGADFGLRALGAGLFAVILATLLMLLAGGFARI